MKSIQIKTLLGVAVGFLAGVAASNLPSALASTNASPADELAKKVFRVELYEVQQKLTPGDFLAEEFSGTYTRTVALSDGTKRTIELTPMVHRGMQVVRLSDNGGVTYSSLNGSTLDGKLLIHLSDKAASRDRLKAEGWPSFK
jgi:hypothetical protein